MKIKALRGALLSPLVLFTVMSYALAAGTGITQLDAARAQFTTFVQGIGAFATLFMLGLLTWDFLKHRDVGRGALELLGAIAFGVIAVNAGTIATYFNAGGAVVR